MGMFLLHKTADVGALKSEDSRLKFLVNIKKNGDDHHFSLC